MTIWENPELLPGVTFELMWVTPEIAQDFLDQIDKQRTVSATRKERYSLDMLTNLWQFTGDPFRFDIHKKFIDGQHRALSIVESGKAQVVLVIRGLSEEAMQVLDIGGKRTFANLLQMAEVPNASLVASIARVHFLWVNGLYGHRHIPYQIDPPRLGIEGSHSELWSHFGAFPTLTQAASRAHGIWGATNRQSLTKTNIGLAWMIFGNLDPYKRDEFWSEFTTDKPTVTSPEYAPNVLRDRFSRRVTGLHTPLQNWAQLALIIRAWNAWLTGERLGSLRVPPSFERRYLPIPLDPANTDANPAPATDTEGEERA